MSHLAVALDRGWRGLADARRVVSRSGSARPALVALERPRRGSATWTADLAERHQRYRAAIDPVRGRVAVVCVTRRPGRIDDVVANVSRQSWTDMEVVIVANGPGFDALDDRLEPLRSRAVPVLALQEPADRSLGSCLNHAIDRTDARFVAKFDDDDRYGAEYLADGLRAHSFAGAGVVGKHSYHAHLAELDETVLRFPRNEFRYSGTLAGGTLLIDRERTGDLRFEDLSLGEDRAFLAACHRRGISTFSADRFNFVQHRGTDNTWTVDDRTFLRDAEPVGPGLVLGPVEI